MLILTNTTDKILISLSEGVTLTGLNCVSSFRDITNTSFNAKRHLVYVSGLTETDVVPSPLINTQRVIDYISIQNNDSKIANVNIKYNANGTGFTLYTAPIASGEKIEYNDTTGWKIVTNGGGIKTNSGIAPSTQNVGMVTLASDVAVSLGANVLGNVAGLSFPVLSGSTYYFKAVISFNSNLTTNGCRWTISGPDATLISVKSLYSLTTTTQTLNHAVTTYDSPAASSATVAATTGNRAEIEGIISFINGGTLQVRVANETAGTITSKKGSMIVYQKLI